MSVRRRAAVLCLALAIAPGAFSARASAQGFLESLFGLASPKPSAPSPHQTQPAQPDLRYRLPVRPLQSQEVTRETERSTRQSGKYRTLCVRMCDGYYFPISASVTHRSFYRDAEICRRSCGTEAKLFYHASSSGDASEMVDLTGRAYSKLPNAFRYRKQLVGGCKCRPEPWAPSELARHDRYAVEEARQEQARAEPSSGPPDQATTSDQPAATADFGAPAEDEANAQSDTAHDETDTSPIPRPVSEPVLPGRRESSRPPTSRASLARTPRLRPTIDKTTPSRQATSAHATAKAAPRPAPAKTAQSGLFNFSFGGPSQKKLRWPGD